MFLDFWTRAQNTEGGSGGAGGGSGGSGTEGQGGQGGQGAGSIMNQGGQGQGAGAGGQGGAGGAGNAGGAGAGSQGGQGGQGGQGAGQGQGGEGDKTWHWMEGMAGTGDRPPWLSNKYKTVDAQARAAVELEKKLGPAAELVGAPEGDYAVPDFTPEQKAKLGGEFDPADPLYKMLADTCKKQGLSQKAFNEIAVAGAMIIAEQNQADEQATADAIAALGTNVDARVSAVKTFVTAKLGQKAFGALDAAIGNNVHAFQALERIVGMASGDAQLAGAGAGGGPAFTKSDVEAEQYKKFPEGHAMAGKSMYDHDKEHRAKVDRMWKQLYPGEDRQEVGA